MESFNRRDTDIESQEIWRQILSGVYIPRRRMDSEEKIFNDIASKVAEHFSDYALVVRRKDGGRMWRLSNPDWAMGMMNRITQTIQDRDFLNEVEKEP